jgi:hypothetical protein
MRPTVKIVIEVETPSVGCPPDGPGWYNGKVWWKTERPSLSSEKAFVRQLSLISLTD